MSIQDLNFGKWFDFIYMCVYVYICVCIYILYILYIYYILYITIF